MTIQYVNKSLLSTGHDRWSVRDAHFVAVGHNGVILEQFEHKEGSQQLTGGLGLVSY